MITIWIPFFVMLLGAIVYLVAAPGSPPSSRASRSSLGSFSWSGGPRAISPFASRAPLPLRCALERRAQCHAR